MPAQTESPVVSQAEIARLFSKTPQTILAWKRAGCPIVQEGGRGKPCLMRVSDVQEWRERQAAMAAAGDLKSMDMDEAKRRKLAAEAASAELALDQQRGAVVEIEVVTNEVGKCLDACRARLLGIGAKVAPVVAIETDTAACKQIVDDAVSEALDELAGSAYGGGSEEAAGGA